MTVYIAEEFICTRLDKECYRYKFRSIRGLDVCETEGMLKVSSITLSGMMI